MSYDYCRIACDRLSQGIFNIVRMTKKCATRRVIINLMDNNKRKPKLVAEHPAACRRRQGGAAATCDDDDVVAASRWGWTVVVRGDGGERRASDMKARVH